MTSDEKSQGPDSWVGGGVGGEPQHWAELQLEAALCKRLRHHVASDGSSVIFPILLEVLQTTPSRESWRSALGIK